MLNKCLLIGRLGKDPETRSLPNGNSVVNFSMATDETYKNKDGEKVQKTEWHKIVTFGNLAEICGQFLTKGKMVYIEGKIQTRSWDNKEGVKQYSTEIVADVMKMLGGGEKKEGKAPPQQSQESTAPTAEEDVPF